mmetsp:Transcript_45263/g.72634  ORF Transcript_45263/g.72634 Transcript_45263/m.72634 type:complete len:94 (+) Transcript_45263:122-403(+)
MKTKPIQGKRKEKMKSSFILASAFVAGSHAAYVPFVQPNPDCECYSSCLVWGDPYIQQLSGERARINENSFVVYENRDVAIQAGMEAHTTLLK